MERELEEVGETCDDFLDLLAGKAVEQRKDGCSQSKCGHVEIRRLCKPGSGANPLYRDIDDVAGTISSTDDAGAFRRADARTDACADSWAYA